MLRSAVFNCAVPSASSWTGLSKSEPSTINCTVPLGTFVTLNAIGVTLAVNVTTSPDFEESWSPSRLVCVEAASIRSPVKYAFAKVGSPVTITSNTQLAFLNLSVIERHRFCAVSSLRGVAGGLPGATHGGFSGGQLSKVNVAVDVP